MSADTLVSRPLYSSGLVITINADAEMSPDWFTPDPNFSYRAYHASAGQLAWRREMGELSGDVGNFGYWAINGDLMAFSSQTSLGVVDTQSSTLLWEKHNTCRGFTVGDDKVFTALDTMVEAYDLLSGQRVWQAPGPTRNTGNMPLYDPKNDVVVGNFEHYFVYDSDTGRVLLEASALAVAQDSYFLNTALVFNGLILHGDQTFNVMAGTLVHPQKVLAWPGVVPFIYDAVLLMNVYDHVVAESLADFSTLWDYRAVDADGHPLNVLAGPVASANVVYVLLSDSSLRAISFENGKEMGIWWGHGVVDSRLYVTPFRASLEAGDGMLFASFGTKELCAFAE